MGYGKKGRKGSSKGSARPLQLPTASEPEILRAASYSYAQFNSKFDQEVLTPSWPCRGLGPPPLVDLTFEAVARWKLPGGFQLCPELLGHLGCKSFQALQADLSQAEQELLATYLVLKAQQVYNVPGAPLRSCEVLLRDISEELRQSFEQLGREAFDEERSYWSFFELWEYLLPKPMRLLCQKASVLCPRYFLVDLACAAFSPHEVDQAFALWRHQGQVYVGQAKLLKSLFDGMRQGLCLENAWVRNSHVEEEKLLFALQLPSGRQVLYAAAPDAVQGAREPLETEEEIVKAGYVEEKLLASGEKLLGASSWASHRAFATSFSCM